MESGVPSDGTFGPEGSTSALYTLGGMTALVNFLASTSGRVFRVAVGVLLVVLAAMVSGATSTVLYVFGAFFIAVGLFDVCVFAPLVHLPFNGKGIRARRI